jgi:hypothetical protein
MKKKVPSTFAANRCLAPSSFPPSGQILLRCWLVEPISLRDVHFIELLVNCCTQKPVAPLMGAIV